MDVFVAADNIISPLGFTSSENFRNLELMNTGIRKFEKSELSQEPVMAAVIDNTPLDAEFSKLNISSPFTRLEKLAILSVNDALKNNVHIDIKSSSTLFVLSTTKGNIDLLSAEHAGKFDKKRLKIWETANVIAAHFGNPNKAMVVSNACISGVVAIILAKRFLENGQYENIVVCGVDILTHFVVSGFQSFKAVSSGICKPYDASRDGISLGEAAGTIILTNKKERLNTGEAVITVKGGASSNDANHISGPSRDGEGLFLAISKTLLESGIAPSAIDHVSGHGTATVFNDDMESLAITDAKLEKVPMNSLKSYFGHTLGAAGVIESVIGLQSMRNNTLIGTYNHKVQGVSKPINVIRETTRTTVNNCLKTAAGFGGCNGAVLFSKA